MKRAILSSDLAWCPGAARTFSSERFDGADLTFDPSELQLQLEQQLSGRSPSRRQQLIGQLVTSWQEQENQLGCLTWFVFCPENVPSPPVRDTGLISPSHAASSSSLLPSVKHSEAIQDTSKSLTFALHFVSFRSKKQLYGEKARLPAERLFITKATF